MTKYLRGIKRLKLIQQYLNGHEDPNYEVFPSSTDGKYIIRQRKNSTQNDLKRNDEPVDNSTNEVAKNLDASEHHEESDVSEKVPQPISEDDSVPEHIPETEIVKRTNVKQTAIKQPVSKNNFDPTVNLEILNQLKTLGEELKSEREARQQKKLLKETVKYQMYKRSYNQPPVQDDSYDDSDDYEIPQPPPRPSIVRSRVNLRKG